MKATKTFKAVKPGEIYPVTVEAGDTVPPELEEKAIELGCAARRAPKNKAASPSGNK